jgi:uncharacterized membrane protein YfcA
MGKYATIAVSSFLGAAIGYLFASRLDTDRFAMKMFAMFVLTAAFSTTIRVFCERMFPSED